METFLKKDLKSMLFVISLTLLGFSIATLLIFQFPFSQRIGVILTIIVFLLTAISLGISINKERQKKL